MSRELELGPGTVFMIADRAIHVEQYESVLADTARFGAPGSQTAYAFTFKGRINNTDDRDEVTLLMHPQDAFELASHILDGLDLLVKENQKKEVGNDD